MLFVTMHYNGSAVCASTHIAFKVGGENLT